MVEWKKARRSGNVEDRRGPAYKTYERKLRLLGEDIKAAGYARDGKKRPDKSPGWSMFPESTLRPTVRRQVEKSMDKKTRWPDGPDNSNYRNYRNKGKAMGDNPTLDKRLRKRK